MHNHRTEHWIIVDGTAVVEIDGKTKILNKNESTYIPLGSKHRLSNNSEKNLVLIGSKYSFNFQNAILNRKFPIYIIHFD